MGVALVSASSGTTYAVTGPDHGEKRIRLTLTGNVTLSFSGGTASEACAVILMLTQDATGSRTVTWPGSVTWGTGGTPTLSTAAGKIDMFYLSTDNAGTSWKGAVIGYGYTLPVAPAAPTSLTGSVISGDVAMTWTQGSSNRSTITQNKIYRRVTGGSYALLTTIAAATSYTDTTPLVDGTSYDYKVSSVNAYGEGLQSNEYTVVPGLVVVAFDDFNVADDIATSASDGLIGNVTPIGAKTWLNLLAAGLWSIVSAKAKPATSTYRLAGVNAGVADCTVSVDVSIAAAATNEALVARFVDANNHIKLVVDPAGILIQKVIGGTQTTVQAASGGAIASGFSGNLALKMSGSTVTAYKNGAVLGTPQTIADAAVLTATKHGFSSGNNTTTTFDNFQVTTP